MKPLGNVATVPSGFVTVTSTAPMAWTGVVAVIVVLFTTVDARRGNAPEAHGRARDKAVTGDRDRCAAGRQASLRRDLGDAGQGEGGQVRVLVRHVEDAVGDERAFPVDAAESR